MRGLDLIFGKSSLIAVLRVLFSHRGTPLSGRQIQRLAGLSNRATMLALDELETLRVLRVDRLARGHAYLLSEENYFVLKALRPALESEVYFWEDLGKTIRRRVHPRPVAAVATGPLARDEALSSGRVDLVLFFTDGRQRLRAFSSLNALKEAAGSRYAVELDATFVDANSMNREEFESLWRRVGREGILLYGKIPG